MNSGESWCSRSTLLPLQQHPFARDKMDLLATAAHALELADEGSASQDDLGSDASSVAETGSVVSRSASASGESSKSSESGQGHESSQLQIEIESTLQALGSLRYGELQRAAKALKVQWPDIRASGTKRNIIAKIRAACYNDATAFLAACKPFLA